MKKLYENFKMVSPLPVFWWLIIGLIAQLVYPTTKINSDNISVTTLQFGLTFSFVLSMLAVWFASLIENSRKSHYLQFFYDSSKQFAELAMGVAGFSSAYFLYHEVVHLPVILIIGSIVLSVCLNHLYLVIFDEKDVGTYKWVLELDRKRGDLKSSKLVKAVAGFFSFLSMVVFCTFALGWLST